MAVTLPLEGVFDPARHPDPGNPVLADVGFILAGFAALKLRRRQADGFVQPVGISDVWPQLLRRVVDRN